MPLGGKNLTRKTALITGSARGLGKVTAWRLAKDGINVITTYRSNQESALQYMNELAETYNIQAYALPYDVTIPHHHQELINRCFELCNGIDILIHNAGPYIQERKSLVEYTGDEWEYLIHGNLSSMFYLASGVIPYMRKNKWGRIITMGFDQSDHAPGWKYRSAFAAAKTGLTSLTKTLALEEAGYGITANMVCPGDIVDPWKECLRGANGEVSDSVPVGRPGTGGDIARVISFLCSEESDFITGTVIPVTGGQDVLSKTR